MRSIAFAVCGAAILAACTVNRSTPVTAWGKKDVSMLDYRTDAGQCAVLAVTTDTGTDTANSAGGISGQNTGPATQHATGNASAAPGNFGSAANNLPTVTGNTYRDSAPADFVNRAAMEHRTQEISEQRARMDALKTCLVSRGYTEFQLTEGQRAHLSKLEHGSPARREYLHKLGTDPDVLRKQAVGQPTAKPGS